MALVVSLTPDQHDASAQSAGSAVTLCPLHIPEQALKNEECGEIVFLNSFNGRIELVGLVQDLIQVAPHSKLFYPKLSMMLPLFDTVAIPETICSDFGQMVHGVRGKEGIVHGIEAHYHDLHMCLEAERPEVYSHLMCTGAEQAKRNRDCPDFKAEVGLETMTRFLRDGAKRDV